MRTRYNITKRKLKSYNSKYHSIYNIRDRYRDAAAPSAYIDYSLLDNYFIKPKFKKTLQLKGVYKFLLLNSQLLRYMLGSFSNNTFRYMHKLCFKKFKKKSYLQSFLYSLERRLCSVIYRSNLISTIPCLKQLVVHGYVYVNGCKQTSYVFSVMPYDYVYIDFTLLSDFLLLDKISRMAVRLLVKKRRSLGLLVVRQFYISQWRFYSTLSLSFKLVSFIYIFYYQTFWWLICYKRLLSLCLYKLLNFFYIYTSADVYITFFQFYTILLRTYAKRFMYLYMLIHHYSYVCFKQSCYSNTLLFMLLIT